MNARTPHDLNQIRPSAELHRPAAGGQRPRASQRRRKKAPRRRRKGWSLPAKIATGFFAFIALIGVGVAGLLYVVSPTELVRSELIRQVKVNTGRELRIKGQSRIIFYPSIGVSLGDVELSNPPGMADGRMLRAERIDLSVALMPLLNSEVHVEHIALMRPIVNLRVDKSGRQSWQFASFSQQRRVRVAQFGGGFKSLSDAVGGGNIVRTAFPAAVGAGVLDKLELRSIRLTKAAISYQDDRSGLAQRVDDLDVTLNGRRIADPLKAKGGFVWQNERLNFDARLDTLSQIMAGRAAKARITIEGRPLSAGFDGTLQLGNALAVVGQTRLNGNSLAAATRWLGMDLPNAGPLGGFQVSGRLVGSQKSVALDGVSLSLGKTRANGAISVAFRTKRPYLSADLKMSEVDIDRLSAGFAGGKQVSQPSRVNAAPLRTTGSNPATGATKPKSIDDLLRRSQAPSKDGSQRKGVGRFAPQVRGYTNRNEWSSKAIDASALGLLDAKARLRIDGLKVAGLNIGRTVVRLALADTAARVDIDDLQLYGGAGKGVITARPRRKGIGFGANLRVDQVAARALLKDAADFDRLDGRGKLTAVISGAGASQKAIATSLNGTASFTFSDGAIVGWNFAKMIRGLQSGQFSNFDAAPNEKTDFSELAASFKISGGNAVTNDLRMTSPLLRLSGQGRVGIGARDLNLGLRPKLVSSLRGQGGSSSGTGLEIPVKLKGPWHDPRVVPDFGGITKDPSQLLDQAKKLGKQFKGKSVGDIVRGALGDNKGGKVKTKDLLKQFLR